MFQITQIPLPETALLSRYAGRLGHHTDCFETNVNTPVSIGHFVEAFFNSPILRLERKLLSLFLPSSNDAQVHALAYGGGDTLSGWEVEDRNDQQLLLTVMGGGIRTWLMVEDANGTTRLLFGSAVIPRNAESAEPKIGWPITALMGFHKLYSRIVLAAAKWQLKRGTRSA